MNSNRKHSTFPETVTKEILLGMTDHPREAPKEGKIAHQRVKVKARRFDVVDVGSQDMLRKIVGQSHQSVPIRTKERAKAVRKVENRKVERIVHIRLTTRRRRETQKVASLKGSKGKPKGGKGSKGGKPKGARASVGEEDEEDILGMGCVLDMTVPPDVLLNQLHSYGNRLTTSSVADTDATDPHFLVDSGASVHLISQSLVDEGYLRICQEWTVNERCTTASGQEMILDRCVEAEFSTYALKSRHVSFLDCDGAAASSPDAASSAAASSRAAAPSPAAPASSSLSPVSRSICAGSQPQRPQKLRVTGLIGYGQVSLLSVALLASKGWTFSCSPGKSCSRTSREVDKPAKPPCLSLSHFGGHDQVPNRTKSSRTHLDIFLWCNVPWISIVHPGAIDIDMSSSLHSLHYTSDVNSSSHRVVRYSTMHEAVQDSVLHVAEREGSSSVHERIDCADPVQPRFRRVEHAFGRLGRYHGVERREEERQSRVRTRSWKSRPNQRQAVIAQVGQQAEKEPSEPREETAPKEETRRVVLVTMEPEESTEVIVKPPEQEPEKSTEATVKPTEPVEKEKGLEMEKRESEVPKDLPEPEIPEKPFVETEKAQEAASEQEVTFRMKAWSNWLHRQDQKDEEKRIRNRARQRALRQQRRSDRAAGLQQAVRKGPSVRRSWTVAKEDPEPRGSIRKVLKQHTKAPRKERTVKLRLVEREVQASRVTAKGEYMVQNKRRAWIAPKARPQPKASESRVKKEFVEIQPQRGVTMVSLTGSEASDVGDMEEIPGALPESAPTPSEGPKSRLSSGLTGQERITSETIVRIGATPEGEVVAKRQEIKPGTAYFMKRRPQEKEKVKFTSQVRSLLRPAGNAALSVTDASTSEMDVGDSRSASPQADRGEPEAVGRFGQAAEDAFDLTDQSQVSAYRPSAAARAATRMATTGQAATCSAAKEAASSESDERQAGGTGESGERQSGEDVGSDRPAGDSGAENAVGSWSENATDQTQSEKSTAYRRAKSGGRRGVSPESQRPSQGSREGYRDPQEREGVHGVRIGRKESTEVSGTPERRGALTAVPHGASIRATGRSDRMGEGTCPPREGRGRTPKGEGAVSFRENGPGLGTRKGDPASSAGRVRERKTRSPAMESRRRRSREPDEGKANLSRADLSATSVRRSDFDVSTDSGNGRESFDAARSASSAIVRGRDCVPQATAGASVQVFGQEGRREVGRDVRSVGREGRHDIQSVQVPPKRGVEPPIRARAHFSNPAFDVVRKKEIVCTVESEPEFEFEYPIKLRGNRLAKHILQSHTPYDPSCAVCLMSKGLKRAPKRIDQVTNEIQMDIANLCTHPKSPNMYRYVVIWNRTRGMIATAAIYVDQASTIRVLTAAINHCSSTGAMVLSDEGRDLTALISELIRLKVVSRHETSRPGRHATGAERAVRTLKTQLGCIRTVLYQHGLMLGSESLRYAAANACHVHNAFQLQTNSSLTPYQRMRISVTSSGEVPNTNRVMPFGCLVFARPTDGYLEKVREANAHHFVPGIYLTPKLSSLGHFVAFEGSQDETVVVPVRDLKIASPIRFVAGLGMLCEIPNSKSGVKPDRIERLPNDLSKPQKLVDLPIHEGEPPWYWSEVNKTSRCPACSNGSETGHSVKCRNRYKKYLEEEYKRIAPIEDESSVPVVPEGLEEGLDTEEKPESQKESGERVPESESEQEKRKRKSIDDEWDRFHREHEERETGERFPEFDDVPFHAPKGQEADTEPTPMQEDPTNPYEIGKNPEPIEDDRMSEGYEPTEVPEGYRAPELVSRAPHLPRTGRW